MGKQYEELRKSESVDEVNRLLVDGWEVVITDSAVIDGKARYFFLLGKPKKSILMEALKELDPNKQE